MADIQAVVDYQLSGLSTLPNQFSMVPQQPIIGCIVTEETVINRDGILATRRGWMEYIAITYGNILQFVEFEDYLVAWTDQNYIVYTLTGATTGLVPGRYYAPTPTDPASRVRFFQNNDNLYWISSVGTWKLDFITNTPVLAGAPASLDVFPTLTSGATNGFLNSDAVVGYQVEWSKYDANNNLIVGAPATLAEISNSNIGYQTVNVGGAVTGSTSTGLSGATIYNASILVNGSDNIALNITGSTATTYTALLAEINTALGGVATATLSGGNIVITSTLAQGSAVSIANGTPNPLFASLTTYVAILAAVNGAQNVNLIILVPVGVDTTWTYNIYRDNQSAAAGVPSDGNGQLVYSGTPTSGQIAARVITYTDTTPDDLRGVTIDVAPSQQGAGAANYQPPLAQDVELYRGYTFYINIATLFTLAQTLVAVGSPDGIQIGDTITYTQGVNTFTITGGSTENAATGTFQVFSGTDPATNITLTAQSIDRVINLYPSNTFLNAYYVSGYIGLPGQLSIVDRVLPGSAFYVTTNRGTAFFPVLPSSGSAQVNTAINDNLPNTTYLSKYLQPEAVPVGVPGGIIAVGAANYPLLRGKANRTSLFFFKGGPEGVFYLAGSSGPTPGAVASGFTLQPFDNTVSMTSQNVCELLDNAIYIWSNQAVVSVSDSSGTQVISRPVERDLLALASLPNWNSVVYGTAYPSEREFLLNVPTLGTDITATQTYVYNYLTEDWTTWQRPFTAMYVRPSDNKLYSADPVNTLAFPAVYNSQIKVERKNENDSDYVDEIYNVTVTAAGLVTPLGTQSLILSSVVNLQANQILTQGLSGEATIVFVYPSLNKIIVRGVPVSNGSPIVPIVAGAAVVEQPIFCLTITHPITNGSQTVIKKWSEADLLTLSTTCNDLSLSFVTDWLTQENAVAVDFGEQFGITDEWGNFPWGALPWGITSSNFSGRLRTWIPLAFAYSNWIQLIIKSTHTAGPLNLEGVGVVCENVSSAQR
jgi:hypothetical protein